MPTFLTRRAALATMAGMAASTHAGPHEEAQGAGRGYPVSRAAWDEKPYRVGNYSALATFMPTHAVARGADIRPLVEPAEVLPDAQLAAESKQRLAGHVSRHAVTGLLVLQGDRILFEDYGYGRGRDTPFHGWSMTKTILALMTGIAIRDGAIASVSDPAARYVPELAGSLHGETSLRHLMQMCSGAAVVHKPTREGGDHGRVYGDNLLTRFSNSLLLVKGWNQRAEPAGQRFNYNELAPLTVTHVLRAAARKEGFDSLASYASARLWAPAGPQSDASWLKDSKDAEIGCIGFSAVLRDWARLGLVLADRGMRGGREIVPAQWLDEMTSIAPQDSHLRAGTVSPGAGYGYFTWIEGYRQRKVYSLRGHHNQFVIVAPELRLVVAQTAVDTDSGASLYANFAALMAELEKKKVSG